MIGTVNYNHKLKEAEGAFTVFRGSIQIKSFWTLLSEPFLWLAARSIRRSLLTICVDVNSSEVKSLADAQRLHELYTSFRDLHNLIKEIDSTLINSFWERKIFSELLIISTISEKSYQILGKKLFPSPDNVDVKMLELESEKLRDLFDDLDDDDTDFALLHTHPSLKS